MTIWDTLYVCFMYGLFIFAILLGIFYLIFGKRTNVVVKVEQQENYYMNPVVNELKKMRKD